MDLLPIGKLPHGLLEKIIQKAPTKGARVLLGPGPGLDSAILDFGQTCLVVKTEPITFATDNLGWYAVQIAANDIATTGAKPSWAMFTILLPEGRTTEESVVDITDQLAAACSSLGVVLIGGHTEITHSLDRPIIVTTMLGEINKSLVVTPAGAKSGDILLITKGVPIEATALLAREFPDTLRQHLSAQELSDAQKYLFQPGISVLQDAQVALSAGKVTAMHDPTEGGIATALWEMAQASQKTLLVDPLRIPISPLSAKICSIFNLDPLGSIASGALLMAVEPGSKDSILGALSQAGIEAAEIGAVTTGPAQVLITGGGRVTHLPRFERDEISRVFEAQSGQNQSAG